MQVCRPCVDDPILLKAIASLVQVRTVMLEMLYDGPRLASYKGLEGLMRSVGSVDMGRVGSSTLTHLENVQANFDGQKPRNPP